MPSGHSKAGQFITVEGLDGVGKTAAIQTILETVSDNGIEIVVTREPGGTVTGERLRDIILSKESRICPDAEVLIIFAARAQHINELIIPSLQSGKWVLCDRFTDATYAYQGGGRNLGFDRIQPIEKWVQHGLKPDLTLLLDARLETAQIRNRETGEADRIENEALEFHEAVREAYLQLHRMEADRIRLIDAELSKKTVCGQVKKHIQQFIEKTYA